MNFADRLKQLPATTHIRALELLNSQGDRLATIHNQPGQAGSVAVYAALAARHAEALITPEAAALGLEWYGEHTADALAHPGQHPNIDRLMDWARGPEAYAVRVITA